MADELSFVLGPATVGLLVAVAGPPAGMVVLLLFAAFPLATGYAHGVRPRTDRGRIPLWPMAFLTSGMACVGAVVRAGLRVAAVADRLAVRDVQRAVVRRHGDARTGPAGGPARPRHPGGWRGHRAFT